MTPETTLAQLLEVYGACDAETLERGRVWYSTARTECRRIARGSGYTMRQVAAVMAITSSDAQLATNLAWTRQAIANHGATAGKYPTDQLPKVAGALADRRNPGRYATGPKVSQFYAAITGDESAVVVDRWAAFAAGHPDRDHLPGVKIRRMIADAYRLAAELVGETAAAFQAIVWILVRETTLRADGRRGGYADIV